MGRTIDTNMETGADGAAPSPDGADGAAPSPDGRGAGGRRIGDFLVRTGATRDELAELAAHLWSGEVEAVRDDLDALHVEERDRPAWFLARFAEAARLGRTYVAEIDGRLAGVCFVVDSGDCREMCFAKTEYLATSRRITFARSVLALWLALHCLEREHADKPLAFHVPDAKSRSWFERMGVLKRASGGGREKPVKENFTKK